MVDAPMLPSLSPFKDLLEKPARFSFGIAIFGLVLLFFPTGLAKFFGIEGIPGPLRTTIGILTLAALVFWAVQLVPAISKWRKTQMVVKRQLEQLANLSHDELGFVRALKRGNMQTFTIELSNPYTAALIGRGLVYRHPGNWNILEHPHSFHDEVWVAIQSDPHF